MRRPRKVAGEGAKGPETAVCQRHLPQDPTDTSRMGSHMQQALQEGVSVASEGTWFGRQDRVWSGVHETRLGCPCGSRVAEL